MSFWQIMNYVAWAAAALIYFWLVRDFLQTNKEYDESILLGTYTEEEFDVAAEEGGQT